jgi:hypothetical protein
LENFYYINGLKCNVEKTSIMFIGPDNFAEQEKIREMGFEIVTSLKCLGLELDRTGNAMEKNFDTVVKKINNIAFEWSRYRLTLTGRLAVAKTFLLSQLTYVGSICSPTKVQENLIQNVINKFVLKGIPWSKNTLYEKFSNAGLGLINVNDFLDALKCSWFKRIIGSVNDNWRLNMLKNAYFNVICFRPDQLTMERPLEFNIGTAFWRFLLKFWSAEKNLLGAPLIKNPLFLRGNTGDGQFDSGMLDEAVHGRANLENNKEGWLKLRCADFLDGTGIIKNYPEASRIQGIILTPVIYMAIRRSIIFSFNKYKMAERSGNMVTLERFLSFRTKGSKQFRKTLGAAKVVDRNPGMNMIQKYCELIDCDIPEPDIIKKNLSMWSNHFLPVLIGEFCLQLVRNSLPVNARMAGRYRNQNDIIVDERCRNCSASLPVPTVGHRETFRHFFWECEFASSVLNSFKLKYFQDMSEAKYRNLIFLGINDASEFCVSLRVLSLLILYEIWKSRINKKIKPSFATIELNVLNNFRKICTTGTSVQNRVINMNNSWCRTWWYRGQHRPG